MQRDYRQDTVVKRVLYTAPPVTAVLLWIFTAVYFRPGLDLLLLFAVLLAGGGLIVQMLLCWASGISSTKYMLASCAAGAVIVTFAGLEIAHQPRSPGLLRGFLQLLMLVALIYLVRTQRQEKSAR